MRCWCLMAMVGSRPAELPAKFKRNLPGCRRREKSMFWSLVPQFRKNYKIWLMATMISFLDGQYIYIYISISANIPTNMTWELTMCLSTPWGNQLRCTAALRISSRGSEDHGCRTGPLELWFSIVSQDVPAISGSWFHVIVSTCFNHICGKRMPNG